MYHNYRQLGYAIAVQAMYDYFNPRFKDQQKQILNDLRGEWLNDITNDMSSKLATLLETNPKLVRSRIKKMKQEEEFKC